MLRISNNLYNGRLFIPFSSVPMNMEQSNYIRFVSSSVSSIILDYVYN